MTATVHTVGHGTLAAQRFIELVEGAGLKQIVDVRSFPGSRRHPQFGRDAMATWLANAGVGYDWAPALGGRRRTNPESHHVALRHPSFRAYADHMETRAFLDAVDRLVDIANTRAVAVMCSESVWWRCHRRLLADHLRLVEHRDVLHLMHDGRLTPHPTTDGVRAEDGTLFYDLLP